MTTPQRQAVLPPETSLPMTSRLLLLTDRSQLHLSRSLLWTLLECVDAGATTIVVRELDLPQSQRAALAQALAEHGATVIAAHTPLPGAVGVHLPAAAPTPAAADPDSCKALLSEPPHPGGSAEPGITALYSQWGAAVGRSCHSAEAVRRAAGEGATYATLSPFAETASKPGYGPALPTTAFAGHPLPVYALAGVTPENAAAARAAGAYGVAVMGAVMRSADPAAAVAALLEAVGP